MGLKYLWDTNTAIYYLQDQFPTEQENWIESIIYHSQPSISVITEIELLCWKTATDDDITVINNFIADCSIFELNNDIKLQTIEIRKKFNLKMADSIIAATAIVNRLTLISRNSKDFKKVSTLSFVDPFELK